MTARNLPALHRKVVQLSPKFWQISTSLQGIASLQTISYLLNSHMNL